MKKNSKEENKICFILYMISSMLFVLAGVISFIQDELNKWQSISNIALAVTFGSLSVTYYKKYKASK